MGVTVNHWLAEFDSQMRSHSTTNAGKVFTDT